MDVDGETVRLALRQAGVELRQPRQLTEGETAEIVQLDEHGWPMTKLCRQFSVGDRTIARVLRDAGVHIRRRGRPGSSGQTPDTPGASQ